MANGIKYQTHEVLNKVLNSGEDALNVDIDNVTLTTEGGDVAIDVALDKANDSVTIYANTAADGSGDSTVPLVDAAGNLQIDIVSSALPSGGATAANQSTIIGHVDGVETLLGTIDSDTNDIKTDMAAIEVLLTAANVDHAANEVLLTGIDADTNAIKVDMAAIEVLLTAANVDHAANEALLTTIDSDTNDIKTDGGSTHALGATYEALYVGVGGDAVVTMVGTGNFTFKNLASGQLLPIRFTHVINTNTTATNMIALKA